MNCDEVRQAWHQLHDDGVAVDGTDEHLRECHACRRYHAQMDALVVVLGLLQRSSERLPAAPSRRARGSPNFTPFFAHAIGWAALFALVAGPSVEWAKHAPGGGDAAERPAVSANHDAGVGARLASMRAAPEIEPLGQMGKEYLVVATELPTHPQVRLYWLYPTGMKQERLTGPG